MHLNSLANISNVKIKTRRTTKSTKTIIITNKAIKSQNEKSLRMEAFKKEKIDNDSISFGNINDRLNSNNNILKFY